MGKQDKPLKAHSMQFSTYWLVSQEIDTDVSEVF